MKDTKELIKYEEYLVQRELSKCTIQVYIRQAKLLAEYLKARYPAEKTITKKKY